MITTSAEYKIAIKEPSRNIKPKVEIYFDGDGEAPTLLESNDVSGIDLLEETQAEGQTPLGAVSSNELMLTLRNDENQFNPNYAAGPYYGKLLPNLKVVPYYGLQIADGSFEWISLGTFRTGEWSADSGATFATVICNDFLFKWGDQDMPLIPTMQNITRYQMWETFCKANGLDPGDYEIDASLSSNTVLIAYYPKGKVRDGLSIMAEAFNCNVVMARNNKVTVTANNTVVGSVVTFADTDMIYNSNMPQKFEKIYSEVNICYSQHIVQSMRSILKLEDVVIPAAGITLENLDFTTAPIAFVAYIRFNKATHISIGGISIGTWGISLQINNLASAELTVDIEVFGHPLGIILDEVEVRDDTAYAQIGSKKLHMDNYLVQTNAEATTHANGIINLVKDPSAYVSCPTRGDMSLELNDTITVIDVTNELGTIEIIPIRYDYRYDSGLGCEILGIKKSLREAS